MREQQALQSREILQRRHRHKVVETEIPNTILSCDQPTISVLSDLTLNAATTDQLEQPPAGSKIQKHIGAHELLFIEM